MRFGTLLFLMSLTVVGWTQSDTSAVGNLFTSHDGVKIYYETKGKGEPVLLIHGFTNTMENWKRTSLYYNLTRNGYQVITIDLRGNGKSDKPGKPQAYEHDAEAKDVIKLIDHLNLRQYRVLGYSRGAIITARLLVLDSRVLQAVIGGMGSDFTNPEWPRRKMFYRVLMGEPNEELQGFMKYVKDSGLDAKELAYMQHGQPSTSPKDLSEISKPVLVICGSEDEDNGSSETLAKMIPGSTYVRVPGNHNETASTQKFGNEVVKFFRKP